jgi:hypothetical protein
VWPLTIQGLFVLPTLSIQFFAVAVQTGFFLVDCVRGVTVVLVGMNNVQEISAVGNSKLWSHLLEMLLITLLQ